MQQHIDIPYDEIADFCHRNPIRKLSLFGSVLRDDIDVLVEFEPGHVPEYITFGSLLMDLKDLLQRDVDLITPGDLSHYFIQKVLDTAEVQYDSVSIPVRCC